MILESIFLFTAYVGTLTVILTALGANVYDIREAKTKKQIAAHPHSRQLKKRPLISVLISTRDNERSIEYCLRSLFKNSYRKFEVIIVDNGSRDNTKTIIKNLIEEYPQKSIRLVARHSNKGNDALHKAYKKYGNGELVMVLDASSTTDKKALHNAVTHLNMEPGIDVLSFKRDVLFAYSTIGLLQKYENLLQYGSKKLASISNSDYTLSTVDALYRQDVFVALGRQGKKTAITSLMPLISVVQGNRKIRSYYANDAIVYAAIMPSFYRLLAQHYRLQRNRLQAVWSQRKLFFNNNPSYTKLLTWFRLPFAVSVGIVALCIPILLTYFIYLTVKLREPNLLILSCVALAILLLYAIWNDDHLKIQRKLALILLIPVTYSVFYIMSFVQIFAVLRSLLWLPRTKPS